MLSNYAKLNSDWLMTNSHDSRGSPSEQPAAALEKDQALLEAIRTRLPELEQLHSEMQQSYEDPDLPLLPWIVQGLRLAAGYDPSCGAVSKYRTVN